jgi:hypothetical protein
VRYLRFGWQLIESSMVSATAYLNKVSADYRYMARVLQKEKRERKKSGDLYGVYPSVRGAPGDGHDALATPDIERKAVRPKSMIPTV